MSEDNYNIKKIRFLVVDDHDPIRKAMKRILINMGAEHVAECFDGISAIEYIQKNRVDMVLCDIYMRKADGFDVLRSVRGRSIASDIPFVMVSGEGNKDDIVKVSDLGADGYIIKPFQAESFEDKVQKTLKTFFNPSPLLKLLRKGDGFVMERDYYEALDTFKLAAKQDPSSARALHSLAVAMYYCNQKNDAIDLLNKNTEDFPNYYKNYTSLANIYLQDDNLSRAVHYMKLELGLNPKQINRQVQLGRLLLKENDPIGAIEHFREALLINKTNPGALLGMGHAYAKKEDLDKAIYYFKRMRRYHPSDTKSLYAAIKCALKANQPRKAEIFLRDEKNNPNNVDQSGTILLAKFYLNQNKPEEGEKILTELLGKVPEHIEALKLMAQLCIAKRGFADASKYLEKATKTDKSLQTILLLNECYLALKKHASSIRVLNEAIKIHPNENKLLFLLANSFRESKQLAKAFHLFWVLYRKNFQASRCQSLMQACYQGILKRRAQKIRSAS